LLYKKTENIRGIKMEDKEEAEEEEKGMVG